MQSQQKACTTAGFGIYPWKCHGVKNYTCITGGKFELVYINININTGDCLTSPTVLAMKNIAKNCQPECLGVFPN